MAKGDTLKSAPGPALAGSRERCRRAFAHELPDRTPLFETYWPFQPVYWDVFGRNPATDEALYFDALAEGIAWEELIELEAQALYHVNKFFQVDMIHATGNEGRDRPRPRQLGRQRWELDGKVYHWNPTTARVELENPTDVDADSNRLDEQAVRTTMEKWDGTAPPVNPDRFARVRRVRELAQADGIDWLYMGEEGGGTAAAQYAPWQFMWMIEEPELFQRWLAMKTQDGRAKTQAAIEARADVVAIGGDVSCNRGPVISPAMFRQFILPQIQAQVDLIHRFGALAVYTSDGNHWPIKEDYFFASRIDGCKECDKAAGMTMARLVEEGVKDRVTIIGNVDARHTLCRGTPQQARQETLECLEWGTRTPGGHILATSHSVHEGVRLENYYAMIDAYRAYFGLERLGDPPHGRGGDQQSLGTA